MEYRWNDTVANGLPDELELLAYAAGLLGLDPALAQSGGGNVSLKQAGKDADLLWVKAAGTTLQGITRAGFTALRSDGLAGLKSSPPQTDEALAEFLASCRLDPAAPLPTLETPLHAALPFRWILHTHDLPTLALTDTTKKDAIAREVWGGQVAYTGYVRPGLPLAKALLALDGFQNCKGLVLGKHGLVVWGDTCKEAYDTLHRLIGQAEDYLRRMRTSKNPLAKLRHAPADEPRRRDAARELLPPLRGLLGRPRPVVLHLDDSEEARRFADSELAKQIHRRGMATPEHILRCGRTPCYVDAPLASLPREEALSRLRQSVELFESDTRQSFKKHGRGGDPAHPLPRVLLLPGIGLVAAGPHKRAAESAAEGYRQVMRVIELAETVDQFRFLEEASSFECEYWFPELSRLHAAPRDLDGRCVVFSGAARGLGRAAALRFVREGAHVVLSDPDAAALERLRAELAQAAGDPMRVLAAEAGQALELALRSFGGVDAALFAAPQDPLAEVFERLLGLQGYGRRLQAPAAGSEQAAVEALLRAAGA